MGYYATVGGAAVQVVLRRPRALLLALAGVLIAAFAGSGFLAARAASTVQAAPIMSELLPPHTTLAPNFQLRDQSGRLVSLRSLSGKVIGLTFLNSHCADLCPIEAEQLKTAEGPLGKSFPFVLVVVSVAPRTDTPASVRAFASSHGWVSEWHWLLGSRDELNSVWQAYGVAAEDNPTPQYPANVAHSGALYLIDPTGYERAGFGINFFPSVVEHDIRALGPAPLWIWPWARQ